MASDSKSSSSRKTGGPSAPAETEGPSVEEVQAAEPMPASEALPESSDDHLETRGMEPRGEATQTDTGKVTVALAHPISSEQDIQRLGLEPKDGGYGVGDEVSVHRDLARVLISAGYAQVDPEDTRAVSRALGLESDRK